MMKVLISIVLLVIGLSRAEDFKCYSCTSLFNDFCSDPDALIAKGSEATTNCNDKKQCLYLRASSKDIKEDIIIRGCYGGPFVMENGCEKVQDKRGKVTTCYCDTSLCNSASQNYLTKCFAIIIAPIAWITYGLVFM